MWRHELKPVRDLYALIQLDPTGYVSKAMFNETWTRYVLKMATGAGTTKLMGLLIAGAYSRSDQPLPRRPLPPPLSLRRDRPQVALRDGVPPRQRPREMQHRLLDVRGE